MLCLLTYVGAASASALTAYLSISKASAASFTLSRTSPRGPLFFWPSASPLGLRPPKSGRPAPNSPISSLSDCGFQPERTETARDLTKNPAVIEDTYMAVGTKRQLKDASRIIGVLRMWYEAESGVSLSVATGAVSLLTAEGSPYPICTISKFTDSGLRRPVFVPKIRRWRRAGWYPRRPTHKCWLAVTSVIRSGGPPPAGPLQLQLRSPAFPCRSISYPRAQSH